MKGEGIMKKNRMLRLASALLILTLLTTSVIGGTFAKYVSTGSVSDTARVAKWGVEIKTSGTLYSDAYAVATAADKKGNLPAAWNDNNIKNNSITVATVSDGDENIIAPGTKSYGNGLSFGIEGKPEVAVTVTAKVTAEDVYLAAGTYAVLEKVADGIITNDHTFKEAKVYYGENLYIASAGTTTTYAKVTSETYVEGDYYILTNKAIVDAAYYPVKYKVEEPSPATEGAYDKKAIEIASTLAAAIKASPSETDKTDYKGTYTSTSDIIAANTELKTLELLDDFNDKNIKWEWAFEADAPNTAANDPADTILGYMIAAKEATDGEYLVVEVGTDGAITVLNYGTNAGDYTVKKTGADSSETVVANLNTKLDISLTVTQVD